MPFFIVERDNFVITDERAKRHQLEPGDVVWLGPSVHNPYPNVPCLRNRAMVEWWVDQRQVREASIDEVFNKMKPIKPPAPTLSYMATDYDRRGLYMHFGDASVNERALSFVGRLLHHGWDIAVPISYRRHVMDCDGDDTPYARAVLFDTSVFFCRYSEVTHRVLLAMHNAPDGADLACVFSRAAYKHYARVFPLEKKHVTAAE